MRDENGVGGAVQPGEDVGAKILDFVRVCHDDYTILAAIWKKAESLHSQDR